MTRTAQSDRVHDYVMNSSRINQYGNGFCKTPPVGLHCNTTFEQTGVIDVDTFLRNGSQSFAITPKSADCSSNVSANISTNFDFAISEFDLRECKSVKTISKVENDRWNEPTPMSNPQPGLLNVNEILGIDTRQLIKYGANV